MLVLPAAGPLFSQSPLSNNPETVPASAELTIHESSPRPNNLILAIPIQSQFDAALGEAVPNSNSLGPNTWNVIAPIPVDVLISDRDINQYQLSIARLESQGGSWNENLTQELFSLGALHQQRENHDEAIRLFSRAMHVNRINSGLYNLQQIPAVEALIESYLATGDWEQADIYQNYLFLIQQRAYGANDPRLIPAITKLGDWHLHMFDLRHGSPLGLRLSSALVLFDAAARSVQSHFGAEDERIVKYHRDIASSAYLVLKNPDLIAESRRPEFRESLEQLKFRLEEDSRVNNQAYRMGALALMSVVDFYQQHNSTDDQGLYKHAAAVASLGDWYLLFDQRRPAKNSYSQAWQLLAEAEDPAGLRSALFDQVLPLPAFGDGRYSLTGEESKSLVTRSMVTGYVDLSLDVTAHGSVRRLKIITEETPQNMHILSRFSHRLKNSHFRPIVEEGEPVISRANYFRYQYWY